MGGWREREEKRREANTLLHKDKDLSTCRFFTHLSVNCSQHRQIKRHGWGGGGGERERERIILYYTRIKI